MERYKPLFKEWDPKAFQKARDEGLLDEPMKKYHSIPDYISEYALDATDNDPKEFFNKLQYIKKDKIDPGKYSVRIVIYKNNFYSIGDKYKDSFIHLDILAHLVLKEGLKFNSYDDFIDFNSSKHLHNFLCLHLKDPHSQYSQLAFSESYSKSVKKEAKEHLEKNVNNYKKITEKISELANTSFYDGITL